jgi:hypothetical protein
MTSTAAVATGRVESGRDIHSFGMKSETTRDKLLFIGLKTTVDEGIISSGSGLKTLLIVLEFGPKQFWFKTVANEGIISSGSKLELLLIN